MGRIYSTQLLALNLGAGSSAEFDLVDVGPVVVVRDICGFFAADEGGAFGISVYTSEGAEIAHQTVPPGFRREYQWHGRSVHPGPVTILAAGFGSISASFTGFVSGYVLQP